MRCYKLEWDWYESGGYWLFTHPEDKTQKDFYVDVKLLIDKYLKTFIEEEATYVTLSDIFCLVASKLPELGYVDLEPITINCFGNGILRKASDADLYLVKLVGRDLIDQIVEQNRKIDGRLDEDVVQTT